jgi:hypothetical protein
LEDALVISDRYRGFHDVAHGGYVAGLMARSIGAGADVALRRPPPLNRPLTIATDDGGSIVLRDGDSVVAEATSANFEIAVPRTVGFEEAEEAAHAYPGHVTHPFPSCFVCGPLRDPGDGLRLFASPLDGSAIVAAPFAPPAALGDGAGSWARSSPGPPSTAPSSGR